MLIEGKLPDKYLKDTELVCEYYSSLNTDSDTSKHYWINTVDQEHIKRSLDTLRNASEITHAIQTAYPSYSIQPVHTSDEVYISVDPSLRKNSDVVLSDCHYDAPFKYVYQGGNIFIRVIIALNKNNTTYTTIDSRKSLLTTLDFNGMDYNRDYHCVEGTIPDGDTRILLKLHFICIHPRSPLFLVRFTEKINDSWTHISRELMRKSTNPETVGDTLLAIVILHTRTVYNNIYWYTCILIFTLILVWLSI